MPFFRTDHWRCAVVDAPLADIVSAGTLEGFPVTALPEVGAMRFLADPFGLWRDGALHVFAEAYDYRDRHGVIVRLKLNRDFWPVEQRVVMRTATHLSYPVPIEADGEVYLLPEASKSGRLSLYRAQGSLDSWAPCEEFSFPIAAIDASPIFHDGLWWMFYTPPGGTKASRQGTLCAAWAENLTGPWTEHPANPLLCDRAGARPGGQPVSLGGAIILPVQDCVGTYGAAVRLLHLAIDRERVEIRTGARLAAPSALGPLTDGLHTLSAAGDVTLIDVKRVGIGPGRHWFDLRRAVARRSGAMPPVRW